MNRSAVTDSTVVCTAVAGRHAMKALASGGGIVEAVFQRTLYLRGGARLMCVGGRDLVRGPLNLCLEAMPSTVAFDSAVQVGSQWCYRGGSLHIEGVAETKVTEVRPWTPAPAVPAPPVSVSGCLSTLKHGASYSKGLGSAHAKTEQIIAERLRAGRQALSHWLVEGSPAEGKQAPLPQAAVDLLGCGPGLTPSGDDILVGALVALAGLGAPESSRALAVGISDHLITRTSRISAAHLEAAIEGEAVEPVHRVVRALAAGDPSRCADAQRQLRIYGQSSGADALAGIMLAANAWLSRHGQSTADPSP